MGFFVEPRYIRVTFRAKGLRWEKIFFGMRAILHAALKSLGKSSSVWQEANRVIYIYTSQSIM